MYFYLWLWFTGRRNYYFKKCKLEVFSWKTTNYKGHIEGSYWEDSLQSSLNWMWSFIRIPPSNYFYCRCHLIISMPAMEKQENIKGIYCRILCRFILLLVVCFKYCRHFQIVRSLRQKQFNKLFLIRKILSHFGT